MSGRPLLYQIGALLLAVLLAVQAISFVVVLFTPTPSPMNMNLPQAIAALESDAAAEQVGLVRSLRKQPVAGSQAQLLIGAVAEALGRDRADVVVAWRREEGAHAEIQVLSTSSVDRSHSSVTDIDAQAWLLQPALLQPGLELPPFALSVRQRDGQWLTLEPPDLLFPLWRRRLLLASLLGVLALAPVAWYAARRLTQPVSELASAAAGVDLDGEGSAIDVDGPAEIRAAATAFNAMRLRLREQAAERTRVVAAVAHDLRTPLTSLRLRAENAPEADRLRMVADIERMKAMITRVVEYAHGEQSEHQTDEFDLGTLVADCAQCATELGQAVECRVPRQAQVVGDELALRRAIANLIDNAVRYAGRAVLDLQRVDGGWVLDVDDWGPGIADDQMQRLMQPFQRLDASRNSSTGGVGLGLAQVRTVALRHGGSLELINRAEGGLRARLRIADAR